MSGFIELFPETRKKLHFVGIFTVVHNSIESEKSYWVYST